MTYAVDRSVDLPRPIYNDLVSHEPVVLGKQVLYMCAVCQTCFYCAANRFVSIMCMLHFGVHAMFCSIAHAWAITSWAHRGSNPVGFTCAWAHMHVRADLVQNSAAHVHDRSGAFMRAMVGFIVNAIAMHIRGVSPAPLLVPAT